MNDNPYQSPQTTGATRPIATPFRDIARLTLGFVGLAFGAAAVLALVVWAVFQERVPLVCGIAAGLIALAQIGIASRIK